MCAVSMIGDSYRDAFPNQWAEFVPLETGPSKAEFDALQREVEGTP